MAKSVRKNRRLKQSVKKSPFNNYWRRENYLLLGLGLLIIVIGNYLMTQGPWDNPVSLSVSPVVLLIAYLVVFPLSILYKKKKSDNDKDENVPSES